MIDVLEFKKLQTLIEHSTFEQCRSDLKEVLPNFPDCVLEQWPYRHFIDFCYRYWWLEYDTLIFKKVFIDKDEIMQIQTHFIDTQDFWGDDFINNRSFRVEQTWLGRYMDEHKSWPKPIIVFDTISSNYKFGQEEYEELYEPYHLLEGHMRLAYMRALIRHQILNVPDEHEVWLVTK